MQFKSKTILEYISQLTEDRKEPISKLRNIINQNIDRGFSEEINYGMIGWVVPHSLYPEGVSLRPEVAPALYEHRLPKTFYCSLPHGCLCQPKTSGMVYQ